LFDAQKYLICINVTVSFQGQRSGTPWHKGPRRPSFLFARVIEGRRYTLSRENDVVLWQLVKRCIAKALFDSSQGLFW